MKMGAVARTQGVVLFSEFVGVADGMEEFPKGAVGIKVEFSDRLGVADGTLVILIVDCVAGRVEFRLALTVAAVRPLPEIAVELPSGRTMNEAVVGGIELTLLDGEEDDGVIEEL